MIPLRTRTSNSISRSSAMLLCITHWKRLSNHLFCSPLVKQLLINSQQGPGGTSGPAAPHHSRSGTSGRQSYLMLHFSPLSGPNARRIRMVRTSTDSQQIWSHRHRFHPFCRIQEMQTTHASLVQSLLVSITSTPVICTIRTTPGTEIPKETQRMSPTYTLKATPFSFNSVSDCHMGSREHNSKTKKVDGEYPLTTKFKENLCKGNLQVLIPPQLWRFPKFQFCSLWTEENQNR